MAFERVGRTWAAVVAACLLAGAACSTIPRLEAANDIHAFLVAIRNGDKAAFDAHVDRQALKEQLRSRLIAEAAARPGAGGAAALGASLVAPLVNLAVDTLVRVDTFRAAALRIGYDPNKPIPSTLQLTPLVKPLGDGAVCVTESHGGPCVLDFRDEGGVWKLTGYEGRIDLAKLGLKR